MCTCLQVVGSLTAGWDAEDSMDDNGDDGSAGVLSHGGSLSDGAGGFAGRRGSGSAGRPGRAAKGDPRRGPPVPDDDDDSFGDTGSAQDLVASEDSGF